MEVRGFNFRHAGLLYDNESDKLRSKMIVSKVLQAILVNDLFDGDTTRARLTTKKGQKIDKKIR